MTGVDRTAGDPHPSWRISGLQRWLPTFLAVNFAAQALLHVVELVTDPPPHLGDWLLLALGTIGAACMGVLAATARRTRVTLAPSGVEIRSSRRRFVPYAEVGRAYRDRFSRGTVTLDLLDGSKVVLPAPVAGLKDTAPELDEAVALIQARVAAVRPPVDEDAAG